MKKRDYEAIVKAVIERRGDVTRDEALTVAERLVAHQLACFERTREPGRTGPLGDEEKVRMGTLLAPWRPS